MTFVPSTTPSVLDLSGRTVQSEPPDPRAFDAVSDVVGPPMVSKTYFRSGAASLILSTTLSSW